MSDSRELFQIIFQISRWLLFSYQPLLPHLLTPPSSTHAYVFFSFSFLPPVLNCSFICSFDFRWLWWSVQASLSPGPPMWLSASGACFIPRSRTTWLHLSPCYHASSLRAPPYTTLSYTSSSSVAPPSTSLCSSRGWRCVVFIGPIHTLKEASWKAKWSMVLTAFL